MVSRVSVYFLFTCVCSVINIAHADRLRNYGPPSRASAYSQRSQPRWTDERNNYRESQYQPQYQPQSQPQLQPHPTHISIIQPLLYSQPYAAPQAPPRQEHMEKPQDDDEDVDYHYDDEISIIKPPRPPKRVYGAPRKSKASIYFTTLRPARRNPYGQQHGHRSADAQNSKKIVHVHLHLTLKPKKKHHFF